jgi:hypothetical protein
MCTSMFTGRQAPERMVEFAFVAGLDSSTEAEQGGIAPVHVRPRRKHTFNARFVQGVNPANGREPADPKRPEHSKSDQTAEKDKGAWFLDTRTSGRTRLERAGRRSRSRETQVAVSLSKR